MDVLAYIIFKVCAKKGTRGYETNNGTKIAVDE